MRIFLGGLRVGATRDDVDQLVRRALRGPWYRLYSPRGQLIGCELWQLVNRQTADTEQCAVLRVTPNRLSWDLVHALQDAALAGRRLRAHRWLPRTTILDRRLDGPVAHHPALRAERRGGTDRRGRVKVRRVAGTGPQVEGVSGFERSHGA